MDIILKRIRHRPETIDGHIYIDGAKVCDCAENAHHCLPEGSYQVDIVKCKQHARKMPKIRLEAYTANDSERLVTGYEVPGLQPQKSTCLEGSTLPPCDSCKPLEYVGNNTSMPCYCPQICPGNGVFNRKDGAIIVGRYLAPGCLSHPKDAFDTLYQRLRKSAERGHEINLIISSI